MMQRFFLLLLIHISISIHAVTLTSDTLSNSPVTAAKKTWFARFFQNFNNYDTAYVLPECYDLFMLQHTNSYESYRFSGTNEDGHEQSLSFSSNPSFKIGPYFSWKGIFLGYAFDVGRTNTSQKKSEFNISLYTSRLGGDFIYKESDGNFHINSVKGFSQDVAQAVNNASFHGLSTYIVGVNVYYIFNHRHFSYPAAYSQSTIQRRSAGSWKLGFSYSHQKIDFYPAELPQSLLNDGINSGLQFSRINYADYNVSIGYSYNWVFARNFLCNLSLDPAFGYVHTKGKRTDPKESLLRVQNLNFDLINRAALVWNNGHVFGGLSLVMHVYAYNKKSFSMTNTFTFLNIYAGFNFHKNKTKRKEKLVQ